MEKETTDVDKGIKSRYDYDEGKMRRELDEIEDGYDQITVRQINRVIGQKEYDENGNLDLSQVNQDHRRGGSLIAKEDPFLDLVDRGRYKFVKEIDDLTKFSEKQQYYLIFLTLRNLRYDTELTKEEIKSQIAQYNKEKNNTLLICPSDRKIEYEEIFDRDLEYLKNLEENYEKARAAKDFLHFSLEKGIKIDATDNYGDTCLFDAFDRGGSKAIEFLISNGADVNWKNKSGRTPLDRTLLSPDFISEFEKKGYFQSEYSMGYLVRDYAKDKLRAINLLISHGAKPSKVTSEFVKTMKLVEIYNKLYEKK